MNAKIKLFPAMTMPPALILLGTTPVCASLGTLEMGLRAVKVSGNLVIGENNKVMSTHLLA